MVGGRGGNGSTGERGRGKGRMESRGEEIVRKKGRLEWRREKQKKRVVHVRLYIHIANGRSIVYCTLCTCTCTYT